MGAHQLPESLFHVVLELTLQPLEDRPVHGPVAELAMKCGGHLRDGDTGADDHAGVSCQSPDRFAAWFVQVELGDQRRVEVGGYDRISRRRDQPASAIPIVADQILDRGAGHRPIEGRREFS